MVKRLIQTIFRLKINDEKSLTRPLCTLTSILVIVLALCGRMPSSHSHQYVTPWVRSISCAGSDYAWFSTRSGEVFRTTNGGDTWSKIPLQSGNKAEMV